MGSVTENGMTKKNGRRREWGPAILRLIHRGTKVSVLAMRKELGGARRPAPYQPVAQALRRLRLSGLVRRADGREGPGLPATYALTAKGRKAAER